MNVNEQAQEILKLINSLSGKLLTAAEDGKVDVSEIVRILLEMTPSVIALVGSSQGNSSPQP